MRKCYQNSAETFKTGYWGRKKMLKLKFHREMGEPVLGLGVPLTLSESQAFASRSFGDPRIKHSKTRKPTFLVF